MLEVGKRIRAIREVVKRFFVGYDEIVDLLLVALLTEGHVLLEGPPGVGKTLLAKSFALSIGGSFSRVQMTPDLLPADIIGAFYYDIKEGEWKLKKGPIHANVVLVDEINRATPKTQSALLEAMQEGQVTVEGKTLPLPKPFLVVATRIPVANEGTYQLPTGEMDRFAYSAQLDYPEPDVEMEILSRIDLIDSLNSQGESIYEAMSLEEVIKVSRYVREVFVSTRVKDYITKLVNRIREMEEVSFSPSPRASIWMMKGARALAYLEGRDYVIPDDVKAIASSVLRHRIGIKPEYSVEGFSPDKVISGALDSVEVPKT